MFIFLIFVNTKINALIQLDVISRLFLCNVFKRWNESWSFQIAELGTLIFRRVRSGRSAY
jgi:hypothetical protein